MVKEIQLGFSGRAFEPMVKATANYPRALVPTRDKKIASSKKSRKPLLSSISRYSAAQQDTDPEGPVIGPCLVVREREKREGIIQRNLNLEGQKVSSARKSHPMC